jgi:fructokinase
VERHGPTVVEAMRRASARATLSFDPNIRPFVTPNREAIGPLVERHVSQAHIVKGSEEDFEWLYPGRRLEESLAAWAKSGPRFCVATLGERGALALLGAERIEVPAPRVEVVDTVGAGDSFMSALLSAMDRDHALGAEAPAPSRTELERWLRFAATASAITCTRKGSDPPTRKEVEARLRND